MLDDLRQVLQHQAEYRTERFEFFIPKEVVMARCPFRPLPADSFGPFPLYPMETSMENCFLSLASMRSERLPQRLAHLLLRYRAGKTTQNNITFLLLPYAETESIESEHLFERT